MSTQDDINKLDAMIREVEMRLRNVETGNVVVPPKETIYGRMDREREERREAIESKKYAPPDATFHMSSSHPVSNRRAEEIQHRQQNLPAPGAIQKPNHPAPQQNLLTLELYAWKEGKAGKVTLSVVSDFVEI